MRNGDGDKLKLTIKTEASRGAQNLCAVARRGAFLKQRFCEITAAHDCMESIFKTLENHLPNSMRIINILQFDLKTYFVSFSLQLSLFTALPRYDLY